MVLVVILIPLAGCSRNMDYVIDNEPCFAGRFEEVTEDYVVIAVNDEVEQADSCLDFEVGDEIVVYYDGNITDGDPVKAEKVYAITMRIPKSRETE